MVPAMKTFPLIGLTGCVSMWFERRLTVLAFLLCVLPVFAVEHPYMLWTREEAAVIRKRIEAEPWAAKAYTELKSEKGLGQTYRNLFRYVVMGDKAVGEAEKQYLLGIIGKHPKQFESLDHGGRHFTCYLDALRYDAVYDLLTDEERRKIEDTFRAHIAYQLEDKKLYTRTSWLPNMQWPRPMSAHLMAVALGDEPRIRALINANGGWKWYFDEYIADGQFYMEEFAKHYSMIGEMLLFCRGLERLGLNELGYGYTGKGGATMRRYLESIVAVGYPRTEWPGGRPGYKKITMGDAKGRWAAPSFSQHAIVEGFLAGGVGGNRFWSGANMNGRDHRNAKVEKMLVPQWFELAHVKWPDARFDYFLAQMRGPADDRYYPTLFWGARPIDPAKVEPPPAPSYVAPERGFAFLRAEESPAYWESPAPAVAMQFATLYVHYVADCFSLLGYHAFNRPLYVNRSISSGYNGGPYDFSVRSHCGVVVDGLQAQPIGLVPARQQFGPTVKIVAVHTPNLTQSAYTGREVRSSDQPKVPASQVYPGVELSRTLMLTREYLFDVFRLSSDTPREYHWLVHALGEARPERPDEWVISDELQKTLFNTPEIKIGEARRYEAGAKDWSLRTLQTCYGVAPEQSLMGVGWYDRKVGVRVHMLGESGTAVFHYRSPFCYVQGSPRAFKPGEEPKDLDEAGGVSIAVARRAAKTAFVALHEPFEKNAPRIREFARIQQTETAVAARIVGDAFSDRVLVAEEAAGGVTLAGSGEEFTFRQFGHVRITAGLVEMTGEVDAVKVRVGGPSKLKVNGQFVTAVVNEGILEWRR